MIEFDCYVDFCRHVQVSNILFSKRILVLADSITNVTANHLISQILALASENAHKDVVFYINSAGGTVIDGLAIHDMMRTMPCDVITVGIGVVASMATVLLAAGTKGKRFALPNTTIHFHKPFGRTEVEGTRVEDVAMEELRLGLLLRDLLIYYSDGKIEPVLSSEKDVIMNAEEAVNFGIIDKVLYQLPIP